MLTHPEGNVSYSLNSAPKSRSSRSCFLSPSGEGKSLENIEELGCQINRKHFRKFQSVIDCVPNNEKEIIFEHSFPQLMYSLLVQNWNCSLLTHLIRPAVM